jgi:hypothetical protein
MEQMAFLRIANVNYGWYCRRHGSRFQARRPSGLPDLRRHNPRRILRSDIGAPSLAGWPVMFCAYCNLAHSVLASFKMAMSGSASFQSARKA